MIDGSRRPADRVLQPLETIARNELGVPIALPLVIEFLAFVGIGIGRLELAIGLDCRHEQRTIRQGHGDPR
jgi:hypothetical protein